MPIKEQQERMDIQCEASIETSPDASHFLLPVNNDSSSSCSSSSLTITKSVRPAAMTKIQATSLLVSFWRYKESQNDHPNHQRLIASDVPDKILVQTLLTPQERQTLEESPVLQRGIDAMALRTRFIDDWLLQLLPHDGDNGDNNESVANSVIVNLGAGMDARPYRLKDLASRSKYIEVDSDISLLEAKHSILQEGTIENADKSTLSSKLRPFCAVTRVQADLCNPQSAMKALEDAGLDVGGGVPDGKDGMWPMTCDNSGVTDKESIDFIAEGLFAYLDPSQHEPLLKLCHAVSGLHSRMVLTVLDPSGVNNFQSSMGGGSFQIPWKQLVPVTKLVEQAQNVGWTQVQVWPMNDLAKLYNRSPVSDLSGYALLTLSKQCHKQQHSKKATKGNLLSVNHLITSLVLLPFMVVATQAFGFSSSKFPLSLRPPPSPIRVMMGRMAMNNQEELPPVVEEAKNVPVLSWNDHFEQLLEYRQIHGHTRVPKRAGSLGAWVNRQRQRRHRLDPQRLELLNSIGFCWNAKNDKQQKENEAWWTRFHDIKATIMTMRNTNDAMESSSSSYSLEECLSSSQNEWIRRQRNEYINFYKLRFSSSCKLRKEQIKALNDMDSSWWKTARDRKWETQYRALVKFQHEHGHCNVPVAHEDRKLVNWVQNTRKKYKATKKVGQNDPLTFSHYMGGSNKLSDEQIALLDEIGFVYDPWGHYAECS